MIIIAIIKVVNEKKETNENPAKEPLSREETVISFFVFSFILCLLL